MLSNNNRKLSDTEKIERMFARSGKRTEYFNLLVKPVGVYIRNRLRIVIANPWTMPHFLSEAFLKPPSVIDKDRTIRGDFFRKPTTYWCFNCEPTVGFSRQQDKEVLTVWGKKGASRAGLCSEERSMISQDYALNWICDFVLGKDPHLEPSLFDQGISGDLAYD